MQGQIGETRTMLQLVQGDITRVTVDAIVNAANSSLLGGGGVDGAIHRAGGPRILEECRRIVARQGQCATGDAVLTTAGALPALHVIHTVGPVWHGGQHGEPELLARAYRTSLNLADGQGLSSIAFPSISTGVYGYPIEPAARIAIDTVVAYVDAHQDTHVRRVVFVLFSAADFAVYARLLPQVVAHVS